MHIFAVVNHVNWEFPALVQSWKDFGQVTHYFNTTGFDQWDENWLAQGKNSFNQGLLQAFQQAHATTPVDLFFSYLSGRWVYPQTVRAIRSLGVKTVNISFDDSHAFRGLRDGEGWCGVAPIVREYDLCVTSQNPSDVWKYRLQRARALFLPPGAPGDFVDVARSPAPRNVVCFVGQKYGVRGEFIEKLRAQLPIETHGKGWQGGELQRENLRGLYSEVTVNLGFGFIGDSRSRVGLKGRDFEVPAAGGCYLTSFHPALARCFREGYEIEFYRHFEELRRKVSFYLENPGKARAIGEAAQNRVRREHLWHHRFKRILMEVGLAP